MCLSSKTNLKTSSSPKNHENLSSIDCPSINWSTIPDCGYVDSPIAKCEVQDIRLLQYNIRGLVNKQDDLGRILSENDIDVALLCETWLNESNTHRVHISGYNFIHKNRQNRKGGGVAIFIKNCLKHRKLNIELPDMESISVEIKTDTNNMTFCSTYRPPNTNIENFLINYNHLLSKLNEHVTKNKSYLAIGIDHNLDLLKHAQHSPTNTFLEANYNAGLIPTINRPTRITPTSSTLIDNVFISNSLLRSITTLILLEDLSDHLPSVITCKGLKKTTQKEETILKRKMNQKALDRISADMNSYNWHEKLQLLDTERSFNDFHQCLLNSINQHAPELPCKITQKRKNLPWITPGIKKSINRQKTIV